MMGRQLPRPDCRQAFQLFAKKPEEDSISPSDSWRNLLRTRHLAMITAFREISISLATTAG
jgi:hypothetical protein